MEAPLDPNSDSGFSLGRRGGFWTQAKGKRSMGIGRWPMPVGLRAAMNIFFERQASFTFNKKRSGRKTVIEIKRHLAGEAHWPFLTADVTAVRCIYCD